MFGSFERSFLFHRTTAAARRRPRPCPRDCFKRLGDGFEGGLLMEGKNTAQPAPDSSVGLMEDQEPHQPSQVLVPRPEPPRPPPRRPPPLAQSAVPRAPSETNGPTIRRVLGHQAGPSTESKSNRAFAVAKAPTGPRSPGWPLRQVHGAAH